MYRGIHWELKKTQDLIVHRRRSLEANRSKLVRKTAELLHSLSVPLSMNIASKIHSVKKEIPLNLTRTSLGESKKA